MTVRGIGSVVAGLAALAVGCGGAARPAPETGTAGGRTVTTQPAQPGAAAAGGLTIGGQQANFGVYRLTTGFEPDPARVTVTSGGTLDASQALGSPACPGWVTQQPDVIVSFDQMSGFLRFAFEAAQAGQDTTLVINDPSGRWFCNDDTVGRNPVVDFADAAPGQYDIWVGSYESGAYVEGQLLVTELPNVAPGGGGAAGGAPVGGGSQLAVGGQSANFGVYTMSAGFTPDPATVDVTSGGTIDAQRAVGPACRGWVTQQPDVIVSFDRMYGFLRFAFRADRNGEDATLVINGPDGQWYCNDDAVGRNPMVDFANASPGQYDVWVGSYQSGAFVAGDLMVTEMESVTP